ncbi:MAG: DUF2520 domain-containing protein [Bacteroidetes bacterium]|nr:DUF2520 domain-containing protein [Bacteroidota bacterium]
MSIKTISIIGSGNIATHLSKILVDDCKIVSVHSRNFETGRLLAEEHFCFFAESIQDLLPSDLFLVCINDDEIAQIINQIPPHQKVAYTSGSVQISDIPRKENLGVFYPLQTFSKDVEVDFYNVPVLIEASDEYFAQDLFDLAWKHSRKVIFANSSDRKKLHLAAVMVNNFVNHIHCLAEEFLIKNKIEFHYLHALIEETARKSIAQSPQLSQTGPAKRDDKSTLLKHLDMLDDNEKKIYQDLTNSILKKYKHGEL